MLSRTATSGHAPVGFAQPDLAKLLDGVPSRANRGALLWLLLVAVAVALGALAGAARASSGVYVANSGAGSVGQFEIAASGGLSPLAPASVATGAGPQWVVVSPDGKSVYVTDFDANGVSQFDASAGGGLSPKAPPTAATGSNPSTIGMSPDGKSVYVTNYGSNTLSQFDVAAGGRLSPKTPATVATGQKPAGVAVSPDGKSVYVTNYGAASSSISQFDAGAGGRLSPKAPALVGGVATPAGVAVSPDGTSVYVTNFGAGDNRVSQFDVGPGGVLKAKTPATVVTGTSPVAVAVSPDGKSAYVTNSGDNTVSQFTIGAGGALQAKAPARVATGKYPYGVAAGPDGKNLYVTNADGNSISQFDVGPGGALKAKATATVPTGTSPLGIAVSIDRPVAPVVPPPPPPAPRNLMPPSIVDIAGSPHTYRCSPGSWEGAEGVFDPARGVVRFTFTWQQLTPDPAYLGGYRVENVATGETYRPSAGTPAQIVRQSWLTRCVVQTSNAGGTTTALSFARTLSPALAPKPVNPPYGNFRIRGIDVFQTIQPNSGAPMFTYSPGLASSPFRDYPGAGTPTSYVKHPLGFALPADADPQAVDYDGVTLDSRKPTVAVVYTDVSDRDAVTNPERRLEVTLSPLIDGRPMTYPDGNRIPVARARTANPPHGGSPLVTDTERKRASRFGVQFRLEPYWLERAQQLGSRLDLKAHVEFVQDLSLSVFKVTECGGKDCTGDNTFRLDGVPLTAPQILTVQPVYMFTDAVRYLRGADEVLARARQLYPGGDDVGIRGPEAPGIELGWMTQVTADQWICLNFDGPSATRMCRMWLVGSALAAWDGRHRDPSVDVVMGIHRYPADGAGAGLEPGWSSGSLLDRMAFGELLGPLSPRPIIAVNDGSANRPLTAAAHEYGHMLGLPHADTRCGGNINGQVGESWTPDQIGRLQGAAYNTQAAFPSDPSVDNSFGSAFFYDLMSYCASESDAWLSARNWNHAVDTLRRYRPPARLARLAARAATAPQAFASGIVAPGGGRVIRVVAPQPGAAIPAPVPSSPIRLRALDRAGNVLRDVGVAVASLRGHVHDPSGGTFLAAVPPAASTVELVRGGTVLDRLARSRPPRVRLRAPRAGARVRAHDKLVVRWRTRDSDGDPRPTIPPEATVEYSADNGRSWSGIYQGPDRGTATIAGSTLQHSKRARVRVTINDGFNEAHKRSRTFRADGTAPSVRILAPRTRAQTHPGTRNLLVGRAFDDRYRRLPSRALSWYAGRKRLGKGDKLAVRLPAGRYRLRLLARDRDGRTGVASLKVRVRPAPLRIEKVAYKSRVARRTRKLTVAIRTSAPATLRARGRRYRVRNRGRLVLPLPARPAAGVLRIPVTLTASGGRRLTGTIQLRRG